MGVSGHMSRDVSLVENALIMSGSGIGKLEDAFTVNSSPFLAAGLGYGMDLSLILPVFYEYFPGGPPGKAETWGSGDLSAYFKVKLPWDSRFFSMAGFAMATLPTSSDEGLLPRQIAYHPYQQAFPDAVSLPFGMRKPRVGAGLGATLDLTNAVGPEVALHFNALGDRTLAEAADNPVGTLTASVGLEAYAGKSIRLESELRHQRLTSDPSMLGSPLGKTTTLGLGMGFAFPFGLRLRLGVNLAPEAWNPYLPLDIQAGDGRQYSLAYRIQAPISAMTTLSWHCFPLGRDKDGDGIPDGEDRCPLAPEDRDGFQDEDGCPDTDNDGDGIPDGSDLCPYIAEDHDGFEDRDGCPDLDNDRDGIPDALDQCPNEPEDRDGYQDEDGCPDLDNDRDGIPDALDKCPMEPENRNGVEDEDGCPDRDTDGDGIPDSRDKCPLEAEIINFFQDEDGCPDEKPEPIRDAVLQGIEFPVGSSELPTSSFLILDGLAARLFTYPGTEIEIQGHVDDRAGPRAKALSLARAQAVMEYLLNRGIEARRLKAVGYGSEKPVASNRTAKGREANRRIQVRRLN